MYLTICVAIYYIELEKNIIIVGYKIIFYLARKIGLIVKTQFLKYWKQLELNNKQLYLAISGGVDSVVLFHLLRMSDISFTALHCNFQLRGEESEEDERFVKDLCLEFGIDFLVKKFETKQVQEKQGKGIQEIARDLRYNWFKTVLKSNQGILLTAHHLNDSLETSLFNFVRGTDLKGLCGIQNQLDKLYRPLLPFTKEEIRTFAVKHHLEYREDISNAKNDYSRNQIRNNVIPELKKVFPNLEIRAQQTTKAVNEQYAFVQQQLKNIRQRLFIKTAFGIDINKQALEREALSPFMLVKLFEPYGFTDEQLFSKIFQMQSGKQVLSKNYRFIIDRACFMICEPKPITQIHKFDCEEMLKRNNTKLTIQTEDCTLQPEFQISLDLSKIEFPLTLRTWEDGDYFYPEGMRGKKKLKDYYRDSKFSIPEKEQQWILTDKNHILWIIGKRKDKRSLSVKTDKNTLNLVWNR